MTNARLDAIRAPSCSKPVAVRRRVRGLELGPGFVEPAQLPQREAEDPAQRGGLLGSVWPWSSSAERASDSASRGSTLTRRCRRALTVCSPVTPEDRSSVLQIRRHAINAAITMAECLRSLDVPRTAALPSTIQRPSAIWPRSSWPGTSRRPSALTVTCCWCAPTRRSSRSRPLQGASTLSSRSWRASTRTPRAGCGRRPPQDLPAFVRVSIRAFAVGNRPRRRAALEHRSGQRLRRCRTRSSRR